MLIVIYGRGEPDPAENQRYAGQQRYYRACQTHQDQGRRKYIERDGRKAPSAAAAGDGAARI